tara:strand:+ start:2476 stop:3561 length:1086 start_codon:yes stop_codon:yes gene_type:complete
MGNARNLADNLPLTGASGNRNIIINGAMQVAQRNTAAHNEGNGYFSLDRWGQEKSGTDQFTYSVEQVSDAPSGFSKSLKVTTSTAETALASDEFGRIRQIVEGNNLMQIGFGTSDAKQLTLSFWVKSSITGNWSASLYVYDTNKIYSQAYTINSANTWEYKTLTYPALTSGSPAYDNSGGLILNFGLFAGSGSNTATTAWTSYAQTNLLGGQTANLSGTLNATWQVTGCQLEVGDTATPFEHRSFGDELQSCKRYFEVYAPITSTNGSIGLLRVRTSVNGYSGVLNYYEKRASPTATLDFDRLHKPGVAMDTISSTSVDVSSGETSSCTVNCTPTNDSTISTYAFLGKSSGQGELTLDAEL